MSLLKRAAVVLGTILGTAFLLALFTSISLDDTIHAREYLPGHLVADPQPGKMYELMGKDIIRSPICSLDASGSISVVSGDARFVNRLGQMVPAAARLMSGVMPEGGQVPSVFAEFSREVYEIVWDYEELSLPGDLRPPIDTRCEAELQRVIEDGNCILTLDTVLSRRDAGPRSNREGLISVGPAFAISFRPECLVPVCPPDQGCLSRDWSSPVAIGWTTRVKLMLGIVINT